MPAASERHTRHSSSSESDTNMPGASLPTRTGPGSHRGDAPSSDSELQSDEQIPSVKLAFQSNMAARIPDDILAVLDSMRRSMELNFATLQESIQAQRTYMDKRFDETDKRFDKRFDATDKRFDETDNRIEELQAHTDKRLEHSSLEMKAQNANRGATHIHSSIQPIGPGE